MGLDKHFGIIKSLYGNLPYDEEDKAKMLKWNLTEAKFDAENAKIIEYMDLSHLNKTRTKGIHTAINGWKKAYFARKKKVEAMKPNSTMATKRTWIRDD